MNMDDLSRLKTQLPAYPGILEREQYFHSAVLIPLFFQKQEYHFVFQKRARHIRQGGEICFPGGQYDPRYDAHCEETAIRETEEELGLSRNHISVIGQLDTLITPHGVVIEPFVSEFHIHSLSELVPDPGEVEDVFTLPVRFFEQTPPEEYGIRIEMQSSYVDQDGTETILLPVRELGIPDRYATSWGGRPYRILVYKTHQDVIWGITAKLIYYFIHTVFAS